jgi:ribosome biogenesis ATPase
MNKKQKLTSMDRQFIQFIKSYHTKLDSTAPTYPLLKWDVDGIIDYVQAVDLSYRRKPEKNLRNSCETAISVLRKEEEEQDYDSIDELEPGIQYMQVQESNYFNDNLATLYKGNQAGKDMKSTVNSVDNGDGQTPKKRKTKESRQEAKKVKTIDQKWPTPTTNLSMLGGVEEVAQELLQLIGMPLQHPEIFKHLGIDPPRGILLHGPPGCGKTMLANAIAGEVGVPFINIAAPVIVSGMSGESEKKIREVFDEAKELAPCILFIDEIDAITPKRETAQREMERRIVAQLLTCMDDISLEKTDYKPVILIGATNRPDSLDPALRRAGRFDREISIGVPDEAARARILQKMCGKLKLDGTIKFEELAKITPGYVGADLNALMGEAGMIAVKRIFGELNQNEGMITDDQNTGSMSAILNANPDTLTEEQLQPLCIRFEDFQLAVKKVQPSSKREGFASVPGVSWEEIGALETVRDELRMAVVEPILHPEYFESVGITSSMGVLLYGPPGNFN